MTREAVKPEKAEAAKPEKAEAAKPEKAEAAKPEKAVLKVTEAQISLRQHRMREVEGKWQID